MTWSQYGLRPAEKTTRRVYDERSSWIKNVNQSVEIICLNKQDPKMSYNFLYQLLNLNKLHTLLSLGNVFHAGLTYGYFHGMHSFGTNATYQFGPMQIFAVSDNLPGLINPANARFANVRVGLNWVFGYGKAKEKARKCESRWMPHTDKM